MRALLLVWAVGAAAVAATPDQVLVLYNADWTEDLDGTEPGQDSLEVARYYVARRTDPKTGKKPYLLGLKCADPAAKRLNEMRLPEGSQDNKVGLRSKKDGSFLKGPPWSATQLVVFTFHELQALDPKSLTIRASASGDEKDAVLVYGGGEAKPGYDIAQSRAPNRSVAYGFKSRKAFPDGFTAWIDSLGKKGQAYRRHHARFEWPERFETHATGPDGVRDDANYLADVEAPIKAFLEDPKNALPDGTRLKDHILYLVICYGLPKQAESLYGVVRGVRGQCGSRDDGSALEARLQLLYHNVARYHQPVVLPWGNDKVRAGAIASRLRLTLGGANPFRHPMVHQRRGSGATKRLYRSYDFGAPRIPHFTAASRRQLGDRFLYVATRLDGRHPEIAKAQVDGALYGERHLTPFLGWYWAGKYASAPQAAFELKFFDFRDQPPAAPKPHERDRVLFYFGDFGYSTRCAADPAKPPVPYTRGFYPGGVGYAVRSHLGWCMQRRVSQLYTDPTLYLERMLEAGVTGCALSAHGAHDTSVTWPDDQVFFHHLLRGYTLGECFLISSLYLDWVQSHVGDPLYRPDLRHTNADETAPRVASRDGVAIELGKADGRYWARVRPKLAVEPGNPEMTDIAVTWWRKPDARHTVADWRFSRRPHVVIPDLEPDAVTHLDVVLTDPYGNRFSSAAALGDVTIKTGPAPPRRRILAEWQAKPGETPPRSLPLPGRDGGAPIQAERGEIHVEFTVEKPRFTLVTEQRQRLKLTHMALTAGGRTALACPAPGNKPPPVFEVGRRYRLIARWRRDPVVRQLVLVARGGREFLLGSNNRLCWLHTTLDGPIRIHHDGALVHRVTVYDDTRPRPLDPLYPAQFDLDGYLAADGAASKEGKEE